MDTRVKICVALYGAMILAACCGCDDGNAQGPTEQKATPAMTTEKTTEEAVIEAALAWCVERGMGRPDRAIIFRRESDGWVVHVGPEHMDFAIEVDPKTYKVLRTLPSD